MHRKEQIFHLREDGHPYATFVVSEHGVGLAVCSKSDKFSKKAGRNLALYRASKGQSRYSVPESYYDAVVSEYKRLQSKFEEVYDVLLPNLEFVNTPIREYPYIGLCLNTETPWDYLRVLFVGKGRGYVVDGTQEYEMHEYSERWDESLFTSILDVQTKEVAAGRV